MGEIQKSFEKWRLGYYKINNIHFLYIHLTYFVLMFSFEFQPPIWRLPKIEFYKNKTIRFGWLWMAIAIGIRNAN